LGKNLALNEIIISLSASWYGVLFFMGRVFMGRMGLMFGGGITFSNNNFTSIFFNHLTDAP